MQEEFRRVYNVLQPMDAAGANMSGFAKLDVRQGRCRVAFSVQGLRAGADGWKAAMLSRDLKRAVSVGTIQSDNRGHAACEAAYDAQDVQRWPISDYHAVCVYRLTDDGVQIALIGHIGKGGAVDWDAARRRIAEAEGVAQPSPTPKPETARPAPEVSAEREIPAPTDEQPVQEPTEVGDSDDDGAGAFAAVGPEDEAFYNPPPISGKEAPAVSTASAEPSEPENIIEWPESAVKTARLFRQSRPYESLDGVAEYRRVPMPAGVIGVDHYLLGVYAPNGRAEAVCYAIPGAQRATPPPGLEGYMWKAAPSLSGGYWITWQSAESGASIPPPFR